MHTTIRIDNFRSVKTATFSIHPGLNVMVGSNGSGKTNLLHALKFLSSVIVNGAALAMGKAGGPSRNFRRSEKTIRFVVVSDYESTLYKGRQVNYLARWGIEISLDESSGIVQISNESLHVLAPNGDNLEAVIRITVDRTNDGGVRYKTWVADESILTRKLFASSSWVPSNTRKDQVFGKVRERLAEVLRDIKKFPPDASVMPKISHLNSSLVRTLRDIASVDEYSIQPDTARQASDQLPVARMGSDGSAVSDVIYALETNQIQRLLGRFDYYSSNEHYYRNSGIDYAMMRNLQKNNPLAEIIGNVKAGISSIDSIGTKIDPSTGRRFVVFRSGAQEFRPEEVSDGTMKWLCLLVALYVPRSRVILLEEPENFMHPWMQQRLVALARDQAIKSRTSVILSTHSATVLNAILIAELLLVRQVEGSTTIETVPDQAELQRILDESNFGLGDVWVSGGIGGVTGG